MEVSRSFNLKKTDGEFIYSCFSVLSGIVKSIYIDCYLTQLHMEYCIKVSNLFFYVILPQKSCGIANFLLSSSSSMETKNRHLVEIQSTWEIKFLVMIFLFVSRKVNICYTLPLWD